jgi:predicted nucleotidyltransferase
MSGTVPARPSEVLEERRTEVLDLIRRRGGENPRVFGSVARGTDSAGSDIDIVVSVKPDRAWEFVSLPRELSELLGVHVDVVSEGGLKPKHAALLADARPL